MQMQTTDHRQIPGKENEMEKPNYASLFNDAVPIPDAAYSAFHNERLVAGTNDAFTTKHAEHVVWADNVFLEDVMGFDAS